MPDSLVLLPAAIKAVAPTVDAAAWSTALTEPMRSNGIVTPKRIAMFVGQVSRETGFEHLVEDLFYSTAERIFKIWPYRFSSLAEAEPFVANPEGLANHVYSGRQGNGDPVSGDGWTFRGRGLLQITGRIVYTDFASAIGRDPVEMADWLCTMPGAAASACWFWSWAYHGRLNELADAGNVQGATVLINGSITDTPSRQNAVAAAMRVFSSAPAHPASPTKPAQSDADRLMEAELQKLHPEQSA